ncbi:MAG TPA: hypothetical protein VMX13_16120 [Sedimentisphaerales bacterium]|nr:hypothetical protein [Sedimentisphaerales bacterium]
MRVNTFFFESTLRAVFRRIERRTGIAVRFENAEGSFWTGQADMNGVTIVRENHPISDFNLTARSLFIDVSMDDLILKEAVFEEVRLEDVEGSYERAGIAGKSGRWQSVSAKDRIRLRYESAAEGPALPQRRFRVDRLIVDDANVTVRDVAYPGRRLEASVQIDRLETAPLFSTWPLFSLLFRTEVSGYLNGEAFGIKSRQTESGDEVRWYVEDVPIEFISTYVGGPLRWIQQARLGVEVRSLLGGEERPGTGRIAMGWSFVLSDIRAEVPGGIGRLQRVVATPVVAYLNRHAERLPLSFGFVFEEGRFEGRASLETVGLWEAVEHALVEEICRRTGADPDRLKKEGRQKLSQFKDYLEKRLGDRGDAPVKSQP